MNKGLKEKIIELYDKGNSYNKIVDILNCSKGNVSYHCSKLYTLRKKEKIENILLQTERIRSIKDLTLEEFNSFRNELPLKNFLKLKNELFEKYFITKNLTNSEYHKTRRKKIKEDLIFIKGGKCVICGYNKCLRSLQFHHLDPTKKDFNISFNIKSISKSILLKELDKCILVCSNCHGEIHDNIIRLDTEVVNGLDCKSKIQEFDSPSSL